MINIYNMARKNVLVTKYIDWVIYVIQQNVVVHEKCLYTGCLHSKLLFPMIYCVLLRFSENISHIRCIFLIYRKLVK